LLVLSFSLFAFRFPRSLFLIPFFSSSSVNIMIQKTVFHIDDILMNSTPIYIWIPCPASRPRISRLIVVTRVFSEFPAFLYGYFSAYDFFIY
jgi:hypothetical protein